MAFFKSFVIIEFLNKGRPEYWKLIIWTISNGQDYLSRQSPMLFTATISEPFTD